MSPIWCLIVCYLLSGVNKPNVRFVIHQTIPASAEDYWQACGRAGTISFINLHKGLFSQGFMSLSHFPGRDGFLSHCFLFYSSMDLGKIKAMIESSTNVDMMTTRAQLNNLAELDRVLSSTKLCRRKSILTLLDEPSSPDCSETKVKCDNCKSQPTPLLRPVTTHISAILKLLNHVEVDLFSIRKILAGLMMFPPLPIPPSSSPDLLSIKGILRNWSLNEIAQLTDFLMVENLIEWHGDFRSSQPSFFLKPSAKGMLFLMSQNDSVYELPVFEDSRIVVFKPEAPWRSNRSRYHDLDKQRFFPKKPK